jgi:phosphoribosylformylglycinamidine synthase
MNETRVSVLVFPGSNCDHDGYHAFAHVLGVKTSFVWHKERDLKDPDLVLVPGGFSYGDYLRSGAIARFSPVMEEVVSYAHKGGRVLGVCNGFQILLESGLLPGAMLHNDSVRFNCKNVFLKTINTSSPFTHGLRPNQILQIPIAHGEGNYVASDDQVKKLFDEDLVAFQYCDSKGNIDSDSNPNGSVEHIAGILNEQKNVLGMMPHPERAVEADIGGTDGLMILNSALDTLHA